MAYSAVDTSPVAPTALVRRHHPKLPADVIKEKPKWAWTPPREAEYDSEDFCHETLLERAHANRVAILGQLSVSIAHEINQPISAVVTNAQVALRLLSAEPTNMEAVRLALTRIVRDGQRAGDIVGRTRALIKKTPPWMQSLDLNEAILEAVGVTHGEAVMNGVSVRTKLAKHLPLVQGDRVQLQQVMLNLIVNAVEAMSAQDAGARDLVISSANAKSGGVLVAVRDRGPGVNPINLERIFEAFYSTKPDGMGMGLSICRAIIERHGGELWATRAAPRGTIFQFTLPASMDRGS